MKMKMHLMLMTAMLSFYITHNSKAQEKLDKDAPCTQAGQCKSDKCEGPDGSKKCSDGDKGTKESCIYDEECTSQDCTCDANAYQLGCPNAAPKFCEEPGRKLPADFCWSCK